MGDLLENGLQRGLRLATVAIALVHLFALGLPPLLANASVYRSYPVEVIAFLLVALVLMSVGHAVWRKRAFNRPVLSGILVVAAVAALAAMPPPYLLTKAEWTFGVVCWAGLLLLLDKGFLAVVVFLATHLALRLGLLAATGVGDSDAIASALLFTAGFVAYQLGIAFAATLLRRMAATVATAAKEEELLRTAGAVAESLHRDRQERYAGLDTLPLLTGLAAGVLDPADERVRTRCAVEAGRMRRLFAEQDEVPDPLLHELRACVDTAERRGVTVYLGSCGRRPDPPLRIRRALTEPVLALLATARSRARVTVVGSPVSVTVHAVADGDRPELPQSEEVAVSRLTMDGRHWVEATWRA
jgi:hypothetical protein